ncbi:hypothetical protein EAG18_08375 [Pseudoalteromonas sp. J010]|uniref:Uncharacterized protein n=1 Tax=Pseudoalteromonas peptidolytica F12-50-A1 TaxID=1315280 RepID=A0A8I0MXM1_9GAMM|nr:MULTISPECIES: YlcI/YnfO family protein [Pseudoalteromonas]MBE0347887.1 hypothetical protein [Pseudoalteromonas peptidolytica F12-50-A1]NLR15313.1 hypothetical protein [Pseudoalteromonas peptidolytica]RRS09126.1 hypothetical protein EAG18_08375 [Pseudoalteromonas sp. J010]GEK08007.1 hypothetical protein PPE03_02560 [Pseudoalteromonas peptidolytica]
MVNDRSSSKLAMLVTPKPKLDSVSDGSDRINARFPNKMIELMDAAAQQKGVSRSRWVSEAIIEFKRIHLDTHLEFLKEIDDKAEQEKERLAIYQNLARMTLETKISTIGGRSLSIRMIQQSIPALSAFQELLRVIDLADNTPIESDDVPTTLSLAPVRDKLRTILGHMVIWERLMKESDLSTLIGSPLNQQ